MKIFSETNIGNTRQTNQDALNSEVTKDGRAWAVVCDGMGGANAGDVASKLATDTITKYLKKNFKKNMSDNQFVELCYKSVKSANESVYKKAEKDNSLFGMGTTVVQIIIDAKRMGITHVGDSRAYLKRGNITTQITKDHSFVQNLIDQGDITEEEARNHPHRNIITRSVGVHSSVEPEYGQIDLQDGDIIVACTDGLSSYLTEDLLNKFLEDCKQEEINDELIKFALESGSTDNITICVIYL